ncbi:MAG: helix-turn-helix domain-containing protein [Flavobacteriales bacterium]
MKQQNSVNLIPSIIVHAEKKNEIMPISEIYENTIEENSIPEKLDEKKLKIDSRRDIQHNEEVFNKIDNLVRLEKLYLNEELTIADIANELKLHPRLISTSINLCYHQNFNRYINSYRVEYAKKLLSSNKSKVVNIEIIGNESGFKSNSSFYNSFKKKYGKTPLQFVKEKREQKE